MESGNSFTDSGYFLLFLFFQTPIVYNNPFVLNDLAVQIRGRNCLAFIIDPLDLSRDEVYETLGEVDESFYLRVIKGVVDEPDWENNNYLLHPAFISMLYPETLEPHFHAMTSGISLIFNFDKINSLEEMSNYMQWFDKFSRQDEFTSGFDNSKPFNYKSREEALQAYTDASTELCHQYRPDAMSVLEYLILMILASTICGDITAEDMPEQFEQVKELARPLKLTEAEIKAVIDNQKKYMNEIIIPNSILAI